MIEEDRILWARERTDLANERNRLANERTFLAWVRTGLASVGGGVALVRLLTFTNSMHQMIANWIGLTLILLGITLFCLAYIDFRNSYAKLTFKGGFVGSIFTITAITVVLCLVSLLLFIFAAEKVI